MTAAANDSSPLFSIIIPARDEEYYIRNCLQSIRTARISFPEQVEVIVVINRCTDRTEEIARSFGAVIVHDDSRNLSKIRNAGARHARGKILATIDADSTMSSNMLTEIKKALETGKVIGGGVRIMPERWSLGIIFAGLMIMPIILWYRISGGLFYCYQKDFDAIGGFNEMMCSVEDIDFAVRLKRYGKSQGKQFKTLYREHIRSSCRKFDVLGDWYLFWHPRVVLQAFSGKDRPLADKLWYRIDHPAPNNHNNKKQ